MLNIDLNKIPNNVLAGSAAMVTTMAGTAATIGTAATAAGMPGYWWLLGTGISMCLPAAVLAGQQYYTDYLKVDGATAAKKAEMAAAKKAEKQLEKDRQKSLEAIKKEALFLAKVMPDFLAKQSNMQRYYNNPIDQKQRKRKIQMIRFSHMVINEPHEIWFRFDGRRLPFGTSFYDLTSRSDEIEANLTHSIRREVKVYHSERNYDIWLIVALNSSYRGIPSVLSWKTAVDRMKTKRYMIPVGVNRYGKLITVDFRRLPHLLVMGSTGNGKSVWLNQAISTLVKHHPKELLQIYMVDMKKGIELYQWRNIPHLNKLIMEPEDVVDNLENLVSIMENRYRHIRDKGYKDISGYNATESVPIPYVLYIVDELAEMTLNVDIKKECLKAISSLARLGRAAGFNMILCTQIVDKTVLTRQILGNVPPRLCFGVPSTIESQLAIGIGSAKNISRTGRAIFRYNGKYQEVQGPFASDELVAKIIDEVTESGGSIADINSWQTDLLEFVFENAGGWITQKAYEHVDGLSSGKLKAYLKANTFDVERQNFVIYKNNKYMLSKGTTAKGMKTKRIMIPVGDQPPATEKEFLAISDNYRNSMDDRRSAGN